MLFPASSRVSTPTASDVPLAPIHPTRTNEDLEAPPLHNPTGASSPWPTARPYVQHISWTPPRRRNFLLSPIVLPRTGQLKEERRDRMLRWTLIAVGVLLAMLIGAAIIIVWATGAADSNTSS